MALIRGVARHEYNGVWSFIEYSDESGCTPVRILGDKLFATEEEAIKYSKGFAHDSYEWVEPEELKRSRLTKEKKKLEARLRVIDDELGNVRYVKVTDLEGEIFTIPEGLVDELRELDSKILEHSKCSNPDDTETYYSTIDEYNDKFGEYKQ